jgi:hypothetical protein
LHKKLGAKTATFPQYTTKAAILQPLLDNARIKIEQQLGRKASTFGSRLPPSAQKHYSGNASAAAPFRNAARTKSSTLPAT